MTRDFTIRTVLWATGVGCWWLALLGMFRDAVPDVALGVVGSSLWGIAMLLARAESHPR